ncbi:ovarian cancer G-protein coupled receptor 1-like [Anabas testudineus]|uniref:G-protein coupled receptors family 1 profile domain-containing protein n=1 Tax=Anabas testudineus TaxID=64144 RepID=A0A7N5ZTT6_ANATE|nr:ovarian cancer G-protein coupled receptor 1-like [Anabas testudineus]XP_026209871.1 ovarian cancer G-protein coupled receptor 1-like [Anabas testudineus]
MEDVNITNTMLEQSYTTANPGFSVVVVTCTIISVGLPLNLVALYAVYSLVNKDHVAPIYVINLLISDLIQLCAMIVRLAEPKDQITSLVFFKMYFFGLMASVGFMVCIALERYCVLACPLWYRFRRTIKISLVVCVTVCALPLVIIIADIYWGGPMVTETTFAVFVLLPYPLLLFSLGGTMKALSVTSSVSTEEKRRIVALLVLVLLIYTVLFLPTAIWCLHGTIRNTLAYLSLVTIKFSPLADLFMYVFLRKGAVDNLLASLCCCRMVSTDTSRSIE